ncbi:glutathione S-transferase [Pseudomonas sp. 250J]|uniref:Glutathione S-transferase N-terminal domain-containing protein n=1 Tax=Pseudomonas peradeniyensis TaxID=2745488 RepID=A0ABT2VEN4_9PSED|nr:MULTISPECIES: glutathione S-transferase [Pseudomonas]KNX77527.1 glutathione S-transferase [Pseudomonas sp. 250J]MCU7240098.1 glutathione S-transferase N-terminal domain-containing protein [Pseudomonas peradeniyensis]MCU7281845.1 glutathione S-transferase N-terminal domain-containing protein [Pseudomonas peradeniyensis]QZA56756.1 glutathione S-transferase N-terminal domain-containing protein [Pseudomonas sp. 2hn]
MAEYTLHCFAESGNAYKVALMLELTGQDWAPVFVDFFHGQTRGQDWRDAVNEQGEVPVLEHAGEKLTQSALILDYLAERTGRFGPRDEHEKREIWRWMLFDNHKFTSYYAALRFIYCLKNLGESDVTRFLRERARAAYQIVDAHLADTPFMVGGRLTIADLSLAGYVYMPEDTGLALDEFRHIEAWKARIQAVAGWKHPYDLMPRAAG